MGDGLRRSLSATENDRKYMLVSPVTIKMYAESKGHTLMEDVVRVLTEDVNYRLRELVSEAAQYMKQCPRTRLTVEDINHAIIDANVRPTVCPLVGVTSLLPPGSQSKKTRSDEFIYLPSHCAFAPRDVPADLEGVVSSTGPDLCILQESSLTYQVSYLEPQLNKVTPNLTMRPTLATYFAAITQSATCSDPRLQKVALADVIRNPKVGHIQHPILLLIQKLINESSDKQQYVQLNIALDLLDALTNNLSVYLSSPQIDMVLNCLVNKICLCVWSGTDTVEQVPYQQRASNIISKCLDRYGDARLCNHYHQTIITRCTQCITSYTTRLTGAPATEAPAQSVTGALLLLTTALHPLNILEVGHEHLTQLLEPASTPLTQQMLALCSQSIIADCVNTVLALLEEGSRLPTSSELEQLENTQLYLCQLLQMYLPIQSICRLSSYDRLPKPAHRPVISPFTHKPRPLRPSHPGSLPTSAPVAPPISDWFDITSCVSAASTPLVIRHGEQVSVRKGRQQTRLELSRKNGKPSKSLSVLSRDLPCIKFHSKSVKVTTAKGVSLLAEQFQAFNDLCILLSIQL